MSSAHPRQKAVALDDQVKKQFDAAGIKALPQTVEVMQTGNDVEAAASVPAAAQSPMTAYGPVPPICMTSIIFSAAAPALPAA